MRRIEESYADGRQKAERLGVLAWQDARNPVLIPHLDYVVRMLWSHPEKLEVAPGAWSGPAALADRIHRYVRDHIRYVRDPIDPATGRRREEFADAGVVLRRGYDDCDGKARLVCALALRAGLQARLRAVFKVGDFVHVQAELRWPGSNRYPGASRDGWVISETILRGVELGHGAEAGLHNAYGGYVYS